MIGNSLAGRHRELGVLADTLRAGADGGAVLLVTGEPGIGKTSLLVEAARTARDAGYLVLCTTGVESETQLPFAGLHQLMRRLLSGADRLPAAQREAVLAAFGLADGPPPELFLIAEAVAGLLSTACAECPVLVLVDDVHWLDPQTHEIVTFLAHRASGLALTVVGAARGGFPGPFVDAGFPELAVAGVDDSAAAAILAISAADLSPAEQARISAQARGNPLALLELPSTWRRHEINDLHPPSLSALLERSFAGRLPDLPPATRDLLLLAAVDEADDLSEILAAGPLLVGGQLPTDVFTPAVRAGLVAVERNRLDFRHPLVRSAVLQAATLTRRQAAHAALAETVRDDAYRRTWHRAQSIVGPDDQVADDLAATAGALLARGAAYSAVSVLERSAQLTATSARRGRRLLMAAEHAFALGRADLVRRLLESAAKTNLEPLDSARMQWLREIFDDGVPGDAQHVLELCAIARQAAAAGDADLALNLLFGAALRCWWAETGPQARAAVVAVVDTLTAVRDDPRHLATVAVTEPVLRAGEVLDRLPDAVRRAGTDPLALRLCGIAAHAVGHPVLAIDLLERAATRLREQGRLALLQHVSGILAHIRLDVGDWDAAAAAARETARLGRETGQPIWNTNNMLVCARLLALRGHPADAMAMTAEAEAAARRRRLNESLCLVQLTRGTALLTQGRAEEAYRELRRVFDPTDPSWHERESYSAVGLLAEAAAAAGRLDDARLVLETLERRAAVTPAPLLHVQLGYARIILAGPQAVAGEYRKALAADLSQWPWFHARLHLSYGIWLLWRGRDHLAVAPLQAAWSTFVALGAAYWTDLAAIAGAELDASSITAASPTLPGHGDDGDRAGRAGQ